jgi:pimeloyl-ACP methyl ester carboxylesterase
MDGSAFVRARLPDWPETLQVQVPSGMTPRATGTDDTAYAIAVVMATQNAIRRSDDVAASEAVEAHRGRGMAFLEAIGVDLDDPNARELTIYAPTPWIPGGQSMYPVGANGARTTAIRPVPDGPTMLVVYASKDIEKDLITINVGGHFDQGVPSGPIARLRAAAAWQRHLASLGDAA